MPCSERRTVGMDLEFSLLAQKAKIFALQAKLQVHTQVSRPSEPKQGETRFVKP